MRVDEPSYRQHLVLILESRKTQETAHILNLKGTTPRSFHVSPQTDRCSLVDVLVHMKERPLEIEVHNLL